MTFDHTQEKNRPRIAVIGVGGAGSNAIDTMIRSDLKDVDFLALNTDAQALEQSLSKKKMQLGQEITHGLGAGSDPSVGRTAAQESLKDILPLLDGVNMVFITAGMGGGTGTGAAPAIAKAIREEKKILTVGVVTKPFEFEGQTRMRLAQDGINAMKESVDTLLIIPNENLFRLANHGTSVMNAFAKADEVLLLAVRTFIDLIFRPGLINLDFADISSVVRNRAGKAMMGTGEAMGEPGEERAIEAAEKAIACPLLDNVSIDDGPEAILINITGHSDMTLHEVHTAAQHIGEKASKANEDILIIVGATIENNPAEGEENTLRVSVVATGIKENVSVKAAPSVETTEDISDDANEDILDTLGKRHASYDDFDTMDDQDPIAAAASTTLQEPFAAFDEPENSTPPPKKRGLFQRFRDAQQRYYGGSKSSADTKPLPAEEKDFFSHMEEDVKDLDIPAFLRHDKDKK